MCISQAENTYSVKIIFQRDYDDVDFEINSIEFTEPTSDDIQEINTAKQLMYYFSEIFGDSIYEYIDQDIFDLMEEVEIDNITEVQIIDNSNNLVYYINMQRKTVDIE